MNRFPRLVDLSPDQSGWGFFLCSRRELRAGRNGDFLILTLQDATGQVAAKIFDEVARFSGEFDGGEFVRVEGRVSLYQGALQIVATHIRRVNPDQDRAQGFREEDCVPSSPRPMGDMWRELTEHVASVQDPHLRVLLHRIVADHETRLREWPAAQTVHHAYRSGFLEHIVKMADVGRYLARAYDANEDLVLAGVVLHDIGKLQELAYDSGAVTYTRQGNLIGHIALGLVLVHEAIQAIPDFPSDLAAELEHLVLSHHGSKEYGSPVEPKTVEAFILAAVDELDAKLNQVRRAIREDNGDKEFTSWHKRLGRVLYKGSG
jgi:3'-5' exoribonuclease